MNILFVDTETTCSDPAVTEMCEIACLLYQFDGLKMVKKVDEFNSLIKPGCPITFEAMAVHHITEKMVKDAPSAANIKNKVLGIAKKADFICAHNLPFDIQIMDRAYPELDFGVKTWIDTLRLSRHLYPKIPSHKLQVLRYRFDLGRMIKGSHDAHRAGFDTRLALALLMHQIDESHISGKALETIDDVARWSSSSIEVKIFNFGKYRDKSTYYVCKKDPRYAKWVLGKEDFRRDRPDLCATLDMYLNSGTPRLPM